MGPPREIDPTTHRSMKERSYHGAISRCCIRMSLGAWYVLSCLWDDAAKSERVAYVAAAGFLSPYLTPFNR